MLSEVMQHSFLNFRPLSKVFMIADSEALLFNSLCCLICFIVNCGSLSTDFPQGVSILTPAFISLLAVAAAISIISISHLVFTLIQRLHHELRETSISM